MESRKRNGFVATAQNEEPQLGVGGHRCLRRKYGSENICETEKR
jgi:hypothetical protein